MLLHFGFVFSVLASADPVADMARSKKKTGSKRGQGDKEAAKASWKLLSWRQDVKEAAAAVSSRILRKSLSWLSKQCTACPNPKQSVGNLGR